MRLPDLNWPTDLYVDTADTAEIAMSLAARHSMDEDQSCLTEPVRQLPSAPPDHPRIKLPLVPKKHDVSWRLASDELAGARSAAAA
jgi:hypothetical protein